LRTRFAGPCRLLPPESRKSLSSFAPRSFPAKFPQPAVVIGRYTRGETAAEAYWKSVAWPGQGLFVGEPLAAPFRPATR